MSTEKTLEKEISDLRFPDCGMLSHNDLRVLLELIRSRESKRSGWVDVSTPEKLQELDEAFGACKKAIIFDNNVFYAVNPFTPEQRAELKFEWLKTLGFIKESPSSVPEPDAEKDQRIAELEKELKEYTHYKGIHNIARAADRKELFDKIRQLEDQLKEANELRQQAHAHAIELGADILNLKSQLQASKVDAEKSRRGHGGIWGGY